MNIDRRQFLCGATASAFSLRSSGSAAQCDAFSVFIADPHVPGDGTELDRNHAELDPDYMYKRLSAIVDKVLAMTPMPARFVVLGDIAYLRGERADYEKSRPVLDRLSAAGVDVVLAMGNHDHREAFFEVYPEWRSRTCVPGEVVSKVSLGHADLLLLDTLTENTAGPGVANPGGGSLSGPQLEWLAGEVASARRPFFVGAHHHVRDVKAMVGGISLDNFLVRQPLFRGYIHGHNHCWRLDRIHDWKTYAVRRVAGLPSAGFWGDIGYAMFRTTERLAQLKPIVTEFCFPRHQPDPTKRPATWSAIVADAKGAICNFPLSDY